jgi:gluconolactonase
MIKSTALAVPVLLAFAAFAFAAIPPAEFDVRDAAEFAKMIPKDAKVEKLAGGFQFIEGPVWISERKTIVSTTAVDARKVGYLVFSDIPANQLMKWSGGLKVETFRANTNQTNGNTLDREGRLVSCEHATRRVIRTERGGETTVLADKYNGKKFNAPNDVVVKSDGMIYFTDPPYGGHKDLEQDKNYVFRINPLTKDVQPVATVSENPNGLCFSPDESKLYVADSGKAREISVFDVKPDGTLGDRKPFAKLDNGGPDGIRCDADGRIWSSAGDGVHIFSPDGKLIGKVLVPETAANLCFGGEDGKTLFITANKGLYSVKTNVTGAVRAELK